MGLCPKGGCVTPAATPATLPGSCSTTRACPAVSAAPSDSQSIWRAQCVCYTLSTLSSTTQLACSKKAWPCPVVRVCSALVTLLKVCSRVCTELFVRTYFGEEMCIGLPICKRSARSSILERASRNAWLCLIDCETCMRLLLG